MSDVYLTAKGIIIIVSYNQFTVFDRETVECLLNLAALRLEELMERRGDKIILNDAEQRACALEPFEIT